MSLLRGGGAVGPVEAEELYARETAERSDGERDARAGAIWQIGLSRRL